MRGAGVLAVAERHDQRRQLRAQTLRERGEGLLRLGLTPGALASGVVLGLGALTVATRRRRALAMARMTPRSVRVGVGVDRSQKKVLGPVQRETRAETRAETFARHLRFFLKILATSRDGRFQIRICEAHLHDPSSGARAFYDAYDAVVQDGGFDPAPLLASILICVPAKWVQRHTAAFRAAERVVTYGRGFTGADPPPSTDRVHAKVTLHEAGSDFLYVPHSVAELCELVGHVTTTPAGSGATPNASEVVVGIMMDASGCIVSESPRGRENGFVESWLRAECPDEQKQGEFLKSAGLPDRSWFNHRSDRESLLSLLAPASGSGTTDASACVVRVVRHASMKTTGEGHGVKRATCTVTLFFVYAPPAPKEPGSAHYAHYVASVKAGFDAMIREGVSVAVIDLRMQPLSYWATPDIVSAALRASVPFGSFGSSGSAIGLATYADYIPTVAVVGYASNWKQGFGRLELYTPSPD